MSKKQEKIRREVSEYYGKTLKNSNDLKTDCCSCDSTALPDFHKAALARINDEIMTKYYGCCSPVPPAVNGCSVLDLGCGTGRDVYVFSQLVGECGRVIGVDMTDEQLEVAQRHLAFQMKKFGYAKPNVKFKKGHIEDLKSLGIADNSIDVVTSNCVINLSSDKRQVFSEIFRALKPGGELYFSDIFSDRRMPEELSSDPEMYGECLGGALYIEDFRRMMAEFGCRRVCVISAKPVVIKNPEIIAKIGAIKFYSFTIRAFKLDGLEDLQEDFGQSAIYKGTIEHFPDNFVLDQEITLKTVEETRISGNTALMLSKTRYAAHFEVKGDQRAHYGRFIVSSPSCGGCGCNSHGDNDAAGSGCCGG